MALLKEVTSKHGRANQPQAEVSGVCSVNCSHVQHQSKMPEPQFLDLTFSFACFDLFK